MALAFSSDVVSNRALYPPASPAQAGQVMAQRFKATVTDQLALNDLIGLAVIPEFCLPVGLDMYLDDLDDATALIWSVGILNTDADDLVTGSELIAAATVGRTAGVQGVNDYDGIHEPATWLAATGAPGIAAQKTLAMKVTTAATTPVAGDIYGVVYYMTATASGRV